MDNTKDSFDRFPLAPGLSKGIAAAGWSAPTDVQARGLEDALAGRDLLVSAPTGTGKTGLFALAALTRAAAWPPRIGRPRALVVLPTRELAVQVASVFKMLSGTPAATLAGGSPLARQDQQLQNAPAIACGTPGRILDHIRRGSLKLDDLRIWIIDEADRLFDAGFLPELRELAGHIPEERQTILLSATLPPEMATFARTLLKRPLEIRTAPVGLKSTIQEAFYPVQPVRKSELLLRLLDENPSPQTLVFTRTRASADRLAAQLTASGRTARTLHAGNRQSERTSALEAFRDGRTPVLVATDVAARGIDIPELALVINFDVPNTPDDYIHRSGRTGRLDRQGRALTLVTPREFALSAAIEDSLRTRVQTIRVEGFAPAIDGAPAPKAADLEALAERERTVDFDERPAHKGKAESPFTRSGRLRREFIPEADKESTPRRNKKKRLEKRILNKKLPHQRRNKG